MGLWAERRAWPGVADPDHIAGDGKDLRIALQRRVPPKHRRTVYGRKRDSTMKQALPSLHHAKSFKPHIFSATQDYHYGGTSQGVHAGGKEVMHSPKQNHLLAALPDADYERLLPHLELHPLELGCAIYEPGGRGGHGYFPTTSIVAPLCVMENGTSAAIALAGNEGVLGIPLFMGGDTTPH